MTLKELVEKYPNAFKYPEKNYGFDWFGFECRDGWADLLEPIAQYLEVANAKEPTIYVAQVKEKFGTLRFYYHNLDEELDKLIREAEKKSSVTCEECGGAGSTKSIRGWYVTLCENHHSKRAKKFA